LSFDRRPGRRRIRAEELDSTHGSRLATAFLTVRDVHRVSGRSTWDLECHSRKTRIGHFFFEAHHFRIEGLGLLEVRYVHGYCLQFIDDTGHEGPIPHP
jgi:hypothetical protein